MTAAAPSSRAPIVNPDGTPTQAFYRFISAFFVQSGGGTIDAASIEAAFFAGVFQPRQDAAKTDLSSYMNRPAQVAAPAPDLSQYAARPPLPPTFSLSDVMVMLTTIQSYAGQIDELRRRMAALENLAVVSRVAQL